MAAPLTTADAEAYVASMNSRTIQSVPGFLQDRFDAVYIFNIYNRAHRRQGYAGGEKTIPACEPGKPHSEPLIIDGFVPDFYMANGGTGNMSWNAEEGRNVAKDLVGIGSYSAGLSALTTDLTWWGVFIAAGKVPTQAELDEAHKKLEQTQKFWLAQGDQLAAQGKQVESNHVEAAVWLNQPRNWANPIRAMLECPGCGNPVKPNIAKCGSCGAILDKIKAMELGLIPDTTAPSSNQPHDQTPAAPPTPQKAAAK